MNWVRRYPSLVYLTVQSALASFCLADGAYGLGALATSVVIAAYWRERRGLSNVLPKTAVNVGVLVAIIHAAFASSSSPSGHAVVSDLGRFLVFVQLIKLFDRRVLRDEAQVLTLSLFVVIAAILTSNALLVGTILLAYVPLLVITSMLAQVQRDRLEHDQTGALTDARDATAQATDRTVRSEAASRGVESSAARVRGVGGGGGGKRGGGIERAADAAFVRLAGRSTLAIIAIAALVFLVAPRNLGENSLGTFGQPRRMMIGFTETVRLGQGGLLSESATPVLDLRVTDNQDNNLGSVGRLFYLRSTSKDNYIEAQRVWGPRTRSQPDDLNRLALNEAIRLSSPATVITQHIKLRGRPPQNARLFAVHRAVRISSPVPALQDAVTIDDNGDASLLAIAQPAMPSRIEYVVQSQPVFNEVVLPEPLDINQLPPALYGIAIQILRDHRIDPASLDTSDAASVRQVCGAIRDHLQVNFQYTLDLPQPPADAEPITWFLTTSKRGQCEYFASAMATLLQSLGIHARLVTGYVAGEFNTLTGEYLVRESNAHAWVEVHVGNGRWQTFDPSPSGAVESMHLPKPSVFSQIRQWYDVLEFNWSANVVGYDEPAQIKLLAEYTKARAMVGQFPAKMERVGEWLLSKVGVAGPSMELPPSLIPLFPIVVISALVIYRLSMRLARVVGPRKPIDPHQAEVDRLLRSAPFYREALHTLAHAGLGKPSSLSVLAHAWGLREDRPRVSEPLERIARAFYRVRFGRQALAPSEQAAVDAAVEELRQATRSVHASPRGDQAASKQGR